MVIISGQRAGDTKATGRHGQYDGHRVYYGMNAASEVFHIFTTQLYIIDV